MNHIYKIRKNIWGHDGLYHMSVIIKITANCNITFRHKLPWQLMTATFYGTLCQGSSNLLTIFASFWDCQVRTAVRKSYLSNKLILYNLKKNKQKKLVSCRGYLLFLGVSLGLAVIWGSAPPVAGSRAPLPEYWSPELDQRTSVLKSGRRSYRLPHA